jgi:tRNA(Ile)-lysidine synthase
MLSLAERVNRTILRYSLLPPGARVMVALSGGADATALACLLVDASGQLGFSVVAAAHFDHRLRLEAARQDQAFCRGLAEQLGMGWTSGSGDVRTFAQEHGVSLEDAGRRLRYEFLASAAHEFAATHVAVGHTRDDQAETVLLQMFRGAGPRGLAGMRRVRSLPGGEVSLVRPLLDIGHADLVAWLGERGQAFRNDESNQDLRFARNRVRHQVLPFLREHIAPGIEAVLARNADIAASDAELLDDLAEKAFCSVSHSNAAGLELDAHALAAEPEALRRRVVLHALRNLRSSRFVGRDQVERVLAVAAGALQGPVALPGCTVCLIGGRLIVRAGGRTAQPANELNFWRSALSIPGEARFGSAIISSFLCPQSDQAVPGRLDSGLARAQAVVDASRISALSVRARRPGDWLRPLGMGGRRKKLQDYLVDRKVPRDQRDRVPLVVDQADRIVWVAGHGIDEAFRVGEATHDVVILRMRGDSF